MAAQDDDPTFDAANGIKISKENRPFENVTITPLPSDPITVDDCVPPLQGEVGTEGNDALSRTNSDGLKDGLNGDDTIFGGDLRIITPHPAPRRR